MMGRGLFPQTLRRSLHMRRSVSLAFVSLPVIDTMSLSYVFL